LSWKNHRLCIPHKCKPRAISQTCTFECRPLKTDLQISIFSSSSSSSCHTLIYAWSFFFDRNRTGKYHLNGEKKLKHVLRQFRSVLFIHGIAYVCPSSVDCAVNIRTLSSSEYCRDFVLQFAMLFLILIVHLLIGFVKSDQIEQMVVPEGQPFSFDCDQDELVYFARQPPDWSRIQDQEFDLHFQYLNKEQLVRVVAKAAQPKHVGFYGCRKATWTSADMSVVYELKLAGNAPCCATCRRCFAA
jgi:hypothetical protein